MCKAQTSKIGQLMDILFTNISKATQHSLCNMLKGTLYSTGCLVSFNFNAQLLCVLTILLYIIIVVKDVMENRKIENTN